jgi:nucleoid-associated protein Lsr2
MEATMATKIPSSWKTILSGSADETMRFGIGGTYYEIDLNATDAAAFRQQLAPYIEHARRAGGRPRHRPGGEVPPAGSADIRAWAKDQGIALSGRGHIPASIVHQYQAAMGQPLIHA